MPQRHHGRKATHSRSQPCPKRFSRQVLGTAPLHWVQEAATSVPLSKFLLTQRRCCLNGAFTTVDCESIGHAVKQVRLCSQIHRLRDNSTRLRGLLANVRDTPEKGNLSQHLEGEIHQLDRLLASGAEVTSEFRMDAHILLS